MMAYISHTLVVQCMNDEWVWFWSCRRAASAPTASKQAGAAMDVCFVIFCVNCFVNSKHWAPKARVYLRKLYTYYVSNVSIFLEMPIRVIPNRNRQSRPPQTRQAANFFTKLSGNLSWTYMSGVEHQNWFWGPSGNWYKIVRGKCKNGNKQNLRLSDLKKVCSRHFFRKSFCA